MTLNAQSEALLRAAPKTIPGLVEFLSDYLCWPLPANVEPEEVVLIDWNLEELHLDSDQVAKLSRVSQLPKFVDSQPFGVFVLEFDDGRLPVGAIRRVVNQLVAKKRAQPGVAHQQWKLEDLLFFCQANEGEAKLHVVAFRESHGKAVLRVISWSSDSTDNRLEVVASHNLSQLVWPSGDSSDGALVLREKMQVAFTATYRQAVKSADLLARKMAEVARTVREEVALLLEVETASGPLRELFADIKSKLDGGLTPEKFADMYAQTMVYGLLTSRITHPEDFVPGAVAQVLKFENPFLDSLYTNFKGSSEALVDIDEFGLGELSELLAETDVDDLLADFGSDDRREDPVVFFYETFLESYDPQQRKEFGTYYTPIPIVRFMVNAIDSVLKSEVGLPLGVADSMTAGEYFRSIGKNLPEGVDSQTPMVSALDPATGTGTYLLEWLRKAFSNLEEAGIAHDNDLVADLVNRLDALEISLSSYSVAHLKATMELPAELRSSVKFNIFLTDSLSAPRDGFDFGDDPISEEGSRADFAKFHKLHTVVLGNPPYYKIDASAARAGSIGAILRDNSVTGQRGLLAEFTDPLARSNLGRYAVNLHNLYVYFWRWAVWKATEQSSLPGVVAFISSSSFLAGKGFRGFREHLRKQFDKIWIINLGGDGRGARRDENVFDGILTPVCIVIGVRLASTSSNNSGDVDYVSVDGSRLEKLKFLAESDFSALSFQHVEGEDVGAPFIAALGGGDYEYFVELSELFPWRNAGVMFARTWPISSDLSSLQARWESLLIVEDPKVRQEKFKESTDRKFDMDYTPIWGALRFPALASCSAGLPPEAFERYGYRSFDRQWCIADNRLGDRMRPDLWAVRSDSQIYMVSDFSRPLGLGPAAVVSAHVPDYDYLHGRGGKDVIPLYRNNQKLPNVNEKALEIIARHLPSGATVTAEDLFAYCYGILAGSDYSARFHSNLAVPGPRVPLTSNKELWAALVTHGNNLIAMHTYGDRILGSNLDTGHLLKKARWSKLPSRLPESANDCSAQGELIRIADGLIEGISADVLTFEVSGMNVVKKWLGFRTALGTGRAAKSVSPLDRIRPQSWSQEWLEELTEMLSMLEWSTQASKKGSDLLDAVLASQLIEPHLIPEPSEESQKGPGRIAGEKPDSESGQLDI